MLRHLLVEFCQIYLFHLIFLEVTSLVENPFMTIDEKIEDLELKMQIAGTVKSARKCFVL